MSFGSGFGGGFGSNNNQQSTSTFGGFGNNNNNNNTSSGFGFGSTNNANTNTGGSLFGANNNNTGASAGAFGTNNNASSSAFGSKPAFGASTSTSGGLFGGTNNTASGSSTFGGFGNTNTTNNTSSPFGGSSNTTGGGLFGNNAPSTGFGSTNTGSTLFGTPSNTATTNTGFGGGAFGAANNSAANSDPPGTAGTPFQAFTEKETNSSTTNAFQSILFQEPYRKWSTDELRLTDYAQGRRHGNASGAGAFGVSSGFGSAGAFGSNNTTNNNNNQTSGFGATSNNTTGGLFGGANTTNNTATSGFGSSTFGNNTNTNAQGGGLFGQNKPASGGLFGSAAATAQPSGGGLFGSNTGGFGANTNTSTGFGAAATNTGGGLFGSNTQQKPAAAGFSFGNTGAANATNTGFGNTTANTGGGLFGNSAANQQQQPAAGGGLFGTNNNQPQSAGGFGAGGAFGQQNQAQNTGGGLFGNAQNKPAGGLFGASTTNTASTGGGLFGNNANNNNNQQQQPQSTGLFGNSQQNTGGGLFGNKPAGGGLFGASTSTPNNTAGGGGLFGAANANNQNQQPSAGGLFGQNNAANNQQQQKSSLFGTSQSAGGGLFGNQNGQNQGGGGLFGNSTNNQQQNNMQSSLLGNSQQSNNAPPSLTASLNDISAYGAPSLFAGVGGSDTPNPGPLATPLSSSTQKGRRSTVLPMYKLAPTSGTRYSTPSKRGYGFSYSAYGTPGGSPASSISSTPGGGSTLGRSLLGSSSTGSLSKSVSVNNLRRTYGTEDSILAPGAFSNSNRWYGSTGSRKLVINRDIRSDIFSTPQKDKSVDGNNSARKLSKRVSFDTSNVDSEDGTPVRGALPAPEDIALSSEAEETPRQNRTIARSSEADEVSINSTPAHERDDSATPEVTRSSKLPVAEAGDYWMSPSLDDLKSLNRMQRAKVDRFTVGRENVGQVEFRVPVDLSNINLDEIVDHIVLLVPRSATVYPDSAKKPPMGKGLNVPARITLEQSWPRNTRDLAMACDPKRVKRQVERLKGITDTAFESYDPTKGLWIFTVEHFTTYGLDEDDEDTELEEPAHSMDIIETERDDHMNEVEDDEDDDFEPDDTFHFHQGRGLPGAFNSQSNLHWANTNNGRNSFLGDGSTDSAPNNNVQLSLEDETDMGAEYAMSDNEDLTRSSVGQHRAVEHEDASSDGVPEVKPSTPGGILRARMRAMKESMGSYELEIADGDDWMEMLRKSVSPVKRDRQLLRDLKDDPAQNGLLIDLDKDSEIERGSVWRKSTAPRTNGADKGQGFVTSIDLMNSLFEKPKLARSIRASAPAKGFPKFPFQRHDKDTAIDEAEQAFHAAARPTWASDRTLLLVRPSNVSITRNSSQRETEVVTLQKPYLQTETQEVRLAKFSPMLAKKYLSSQDKLTDIALVDGVPIATLRVARLQDMYYQESMNDPGRLHEKQIWQLASILFDDVDETDNLARKSRLSRFWTELVEPVSTTTIAMAASSEEKAVACLAGHRVVDACRHLLEGKNFHLGTLVPMIGTNDATKKDIREQLKAWHASNTLTEFSEPIRTIYELLSGNVCVCEGIKVADVENRMESFVISRKFGLDWKQSFGLRLWYAISQGDDLSEAVRKFKQDITQDREDPPRPWYVEQGIPSLWDDALQSTRRDLLWGLLELYTYSDANLEAILRPENSQLTPLDMRLSWQLGLALTSTGKVSYHRDAQEKSDACTIAFSAQLTGAGEWLEAVFVLLHLSDAAARQHAIKEHLSRNATLIDDNSFSVLTGKLHIPEQWIWEAKALLMRNRGDFSAEVGHLLRAGAFTDAHQVFMNHVAPLAIIERDHVQLGDIIAQFSGHQASVSEWHLGGEIYAHFLTLVKCKKRGEDTPGDVLEKLLAGLDAMGKELPGKDVLRFAAISDMADETAREILRITRKHQDTNLKGRILSLPLTQDRLLAYSVDLSMDRYREVMSH